MELSFTAKKEKDTDRKMSTWPPIKSIHVWEEKCWLIIEIINLLMTFNLLTLVHHGQMRLLFPQLLRNRNKGFAAFLKRNNLKSFKLNHISEEKRAHRSCREAQSGSVGTAADSTLALFVWKILFLWWSCFSVLFSLGTKPDVLSTLGLPDRTLDTLDPVSAKPSP